ARVRALTRSSAPGIFPPGVDHQTVGEIHADTDWSETLRGVEAIVHAAGRAHVLNDRVEDPRAAYFATNAAGTERLARAAVEAGVKRLIFVSSVKVNGEATNGAPFTERTPPSPVDAYAVSKWQAEQRLHELSRASGLEVVVVRPPLVHGPGVKANFL